MNLMTPLTPLSPVPVTAHMIIKRSLARQTLPARRRIIDTRSLQSESLERPAGLTQRPLLRAAAPQQEKSLRGPICDTADKSRASCGSSPTLLEKCNQPFKTRNGLYRWAASRKQRSRIASFHGQSESCRSDAAQSGVHDNVKISEPIDARASLAPFRSIWSPG